MKKSVERMQEVLKLLAECQSSGYGCSAITVKVGGVNAQNMVEHDVIYVVECPRMVVDTLTAHGYHMSMTQQGLRIDCNF